MKIETYSFYNETAKININITKYIKTNFGRIESVIKYFKKLNPDRLDEYLLSFQNRIISNLGEFRYNLEKFDLEVIEQDLRLLVEYPELEEVIFLLLCKLLELPEDLDSIEEEIELIYFNVRKAEGHLSYYRVKAFEDLLGKEEGTKFYKEIVEYLIKETKEQDTSDQPEDPLSLTRTESREFVLKRYAKYGVANFTLGRYDDFKEIYRFDKCIVPEVLKVFNDPDIAYLSSCYPRDSPSSNEGHIVKMRRTRTLHHDDMCDELYWNDHVHPNTEHPSIEFTKSMGKE